ncbi:MAG TPA: TIGR01458 family HAD-type hydrolase [Thermoanaerobaculia bacterium]|jgi:HAD superfamily hydrolase (TIGR01458 family)|nr:TIGR01458 family HAD-type hydrolase [Thermoanaerobaculia bacterium]
MPRRADGVLLDLDGTVYQEGRAIPGAAEALAALRRSGVPFRFTTNTTRRPRSVLAEQLTGLGIPARREEILSAPAAAAEWLRGQGIGRIHLLIAAATHEEFADFTLDDRTPEAVVVGDLGAEWTFQILNQAFRCLMDGAALLAVQRNRYWQTDGGLSLDAGPFVAALEYGSGKTATLVGKPSPAFFAAAAHQLGAPPDRIAVVGDDLESDVAGARAAGMIGVAVRTGKYRPQDEDRARAAAVTVLDSIAGLPGWLGL